MAFTNEELSALSQLFDSKLLPLKDDIQGIRGNVQGLKDDVQVLKDVFLLNIQNETEILPRLQNIEACYTSTNDMYKSRASQIGTMQKDMDVMKIAIADHSQKLQAPGC
ncbi:MAG: hypothetical protein HFI88_10740 [Lachnospiraceae bacterium]|nr:hypothetical protein [Lachnospiraceae bacterium]